MQLINFIERLQNISPYGSLINILESVEVDGEVKSIKIEIKLNTEETK